MQISEGEKTTDCTPTQRLARVVWWLTECVQHALPVTRAAAELGKEPEDAARILRELSAVIPVGADGNGWARQHGRMNRLPTSANERIAVAVWAFAALEARLTTKQVAELLGINERPALHLLQLIAGACPITCVDGLWQPCGVEYRPRYTLRDRRCFHCGGVNSLRTGRVLGWPVWFCRRCEGEYRRLQQ